MNTENQNNKILVSEGFGVSVFVCPPDYADGEKLEYNPNAKSVDQIIASLDPRNLIQEQIRKKEQKEKLEKEFLEKIEKDIAETKTFINNNGKFEEIKKEESKQELGKMLAAIIANEPIVKSQTLEEILSSTPVPAKQEKKPNVQTDVVLFVTHAGVQDKGFDIVTNPKNKQILKDAGVELQRVKGSFKFLNTNNFNNIKFVLDDVRETGHKISHVVLTRPLNLDPLSASRLTNICNELAIIIRNVNPVECVEFSY